jgi:hypothetical protein
VTQPEALTIMHQYTNAGSATITKYEHRPIQRVFPNDGSTDLSNAINAGSKINRLDSHKNSGLR